MQLTSQCPHTSREFRMLLSGACNARHVRLGVFLVEFSQAGAEGVKSGKMGFVLCFL